MEKTSSTTSREKNHDDDTDAPARLAGRPIAGCPLAGRPDPCRRFDAGGMWRQRGGWERRAGPGWGGAPWPVAPLRAALPLAAASMRAACGGSGGDGTAGPIQGKNTVDPAQLQGRWGSALGGRDPMTAVVVP